MADEPDTEVTEAPKKGRSDSEKREILKEARERHKRTLDYEATFRTHFKADVKFSEGDAYNNWQWPEDVLNDRDKKPSLTINRVRQHNLDILNDARQSRIAVQVRPLRSGASYEAAMTYDGLIRHIEYVSNADSAYQAALKFAVQGGIGYIRLTTDYVGDDTFDQEIYVRGFFSADEVMMVLLDPDITEFDGSDAKFGFIFTSVARPVFDAKYPKLKDSVGSTELKPEETWASDDRVIVAEYFRAVPQEKKLVTYIDPETGEQVTDTTDKVKAEILEAVIDTEGYAERLVIDTKIEHFKIIGDTLQEENVWPGKYIPIIRCIGEETVIDGQMDRKGHTRALIDSQRMFNYNASASVEYGALQTKVPWTGPGAAIENYESDWNNANIENKSYLAYNHVDEDGNPIPKPERPQPPTGAPVFMQGMRDALEQMYLASGQNQADFGQPGNERSGVAIQQRQRQGDNATYHYLDHQASMIRLAGKQMLDLIPKVYDTERVVKYRDDAGNESDVTINPDAPTAHERVENKTGPDQVMLNPNIGVYDVQADVGPAYATRRQEAFNAFSTLLGSNKELISLVGDIWMRFADIPGGEEAAQRLKRMVPQQAMQDGPPPDLVAANQQIQALTAMVEKLTMKLENREDEGVHKQEKNAIDAYRATTDRIGSLEKALALDPGGLLVLVKEVIEEAQAQSAGGNALEHAVDDEPKTEDIHPGMGGQLQPPPPHAPPVDPNNLIEPPSTEVAEPASA